MASIIVSCGCIFEKWHNGTHGRECVPTGISLVFVSGPCDWKAVLPYDYAKSNKNKIRENI